MRIIPINNRQSGFGSYFPLTEEEIYHNFGKTRGDYINQAMTDLVPIAHINGAGLDVVVKTIENEDIFKRGINIAIADEKSDIWFDYLFHGNTKNPQHVRANVFFDNIAKLEEIPKIICENAKGLIEAYKDCRKNPSLFGYYSKNFK